MPDEHELDRAFHFIMGRLVETGQAPHYTELAAALGCEVEAGRQMLHRLMDSGFPGWLHPGTDLIASFAPFNNLPTQYRIAVDGQRRWFAQCGFEALATRWLFPGKTVRVEAPCLDCNQPMVIEIRDERLLRVEPVGIVGHLNASWTLLRDPANRPFV